jgi:4-amino-4-deoxy-L-arabinose transferase-like glycosyltransferase
MRWRGRRESPVEKLQSHGLFEQHRNQEILFPMIPRTRADALLIAGFCGFLFLYGLSQFGLIGADEPRYAQVAREMLDRRDWITPVLGGTPWLEKPPLYYWQAMLTYSLFGVSDWAARLPSAIDASFMMLAIYLFVRRFRRGVELDAALITASCAGVIGYARAASMDMALAAAFTIGMLGWWAWRERGTRIYLVSFYLFMALGTLAKGPVAPFLAVLVIILYAAATREWRVALKTIWVPGIILFCVIALPWFFAVQMRNPEFLRVFLLQHNLARFATDLYHHREPFWYYVPVTALALVPWTVFVLVAGARTVRAWWGERKSSSLDLELQFNLFTGLWLIVPVLFFSLSQSKLPGYILPAIPAGALFLADYLRQHLGGEKSEPLAKWLVVLHALVATCWIVPALLIAYLITERRLPPVKPMFIALSVAFILAVGMAITLVSRLGLRMLRFVTLIPLVLAVAAVLKLGSTALDQTLSARPLAREISSMETRPLLLAVYGVSRELEYGLTFYRNGRTVRYEFENVPVEEHLLVTPENWQPEVTKRAAGRRVSFLGHFPPQHVDYFWISAASSTPGAPSEHAIH